MVIDLCEHEKHEMNPACTESRMISHCRQGWKNDGIIWNEQSKGHAGTCLQKEFLHPEKWYKFVREREWCEPFSPLLDEFLTSGGWRQNRCKRMPSMSSHFSQTRHNPNTLHIVVLCRSYAHFLRVNAVLSVMKIVKDVIAVHNCASMEMELCSAVWPSLGSDNIAPAFMWPYHQLIIPDCAKDFFACSMCNVQCRWAVHA